MVGEVPALAEPALDHIPANATLLGGLLGGREASGRLVGIDEALPLVGTLAAVSSSLQLPVAALGEEVLLALGAVEALATGCKSGRSQEGAALEIRGDWYELPMVGMAEHLHSSRNSLAAAVTLEAWLVR